MYIYIGFPKKAYRPAVYPFALLFYLQCRTFYTNLVKKHIWSSMKYIKEKATEQNPKHLPFGVISFSKQLKTLKQNNAVSHIWLLSNLFLLRQMAFRSYCGKSLVMTHEL